MSNTTNMRIFHCALQFCVTYTDNPTVLPEEFTPGGPWTGVSCTVGTTPVKDVCPSGYYVYYVSGFEV